MTKYLVEILIIVAWCFGGYELASSGECPNGPEYYLECLEGKNPVSELDNCSDPFHCFWCVGHLYQGLERWASDREAKRMREFREVAYHDRLVAVAQKYLDDPGASDPTRQAAAEALAFQGIGRVGGHDVFSILVGEPRHEVPFRDWYVLAALGDPRTVELARKEYARLKKIDPATDRLAQPALLNIVDCLYHIPGNAAPHLLRELAATETNAELRDELKRVVWKRSSKR
jgi:hypothetical protein